MNTCGLEGIRLEQKMEFAPVSVNTALSVGLVVNEVLTNSFKILVADDGVGLPEGVTWPAPGKIGALIVQTLRENAKTDFNVESAPEKGVRVTMDVDRKIAARDHLQG